MKSIKLNENLKKIESFRNLPGNWNDSSAGRIDYELITMAKFIIQNIDRQPRVFPTARDSIQFEFYDTGNENRYLEFEVFKEKIEVFEAAGKKEKEYTIPIDMKKVCEIIDVFYT